MKTRSSAGGGDGVNLDEDDVLRDSGSPLGKKCLPVAGADVLSKHQTKQGRFKAPPNPTTLNRFRETLEAPNKSGLVNYEKSVSELLLY